MKLLVHTCCAPCAICVINEAKKDNLSVTGFFCNSNIHPRPEYLKRMGVARRYFESAGGDFSSPEYDAGDFFKLVAGRQNPHHRCLGCWEMRVAKSIDFAQNNGFDFFTTTLLGSPYQDHGALRGICENLSRRKKVRFYYKDFRQGFRRAHKIAGEKGIYCQK